MERCCKQCASEFTITDEDLEFYKKISPVFNGVKYAIPAPTLCPDCRSRRRISHRNGRTLYQRTCDGTGKDIISVYHPDLIFPVYSVDYWFSDKWDALDYGREFDFSRPFFEQFKELSDQVPRACLQNEANENSDFTSYAAWNKDCYLIFYSDHNQECYYIGDSFHNRNCSDASFSNRNELCYELINSFDSYNCKFIYDSKNCLDSWFLQNCLGCKNCFGCVNLRNKEYYFFNKPLEKEAYLERMKNIDTGSRRVMEDLKMKFLSYAKQFPRKAIHGVQNENVTGDYINNSKNLSHCFHVENSQDCSFINECQKCKDAYDVDGWGGSGAELLYECQTVGESVHNILFCNFANNSSSNIFYSELCTIGCKNLFGCSGLKKQQYCILNKQYTKEEYENLVPRIIEHMKKTGEFGEFFPMGLSYFGYNETHAYEQFPISKEEAIAQGIKWRDKDPKDYQTQTYVVPDSIGEVEDAICQAVLSCEITGKNYKIIPQELEFYRKMQLPIPRKCHEERHLDRFKLQNHRQIFSRDCMKCGVGIKTSYSPERPEIVYCEKCHLEGVY